MMTPTQSRRYGRMVRDFTLDEARAYNEHLLAGKTAEDFFAKMENKVVVEKTKSVYVVPPLMKHLAGQHDQTTHGSWATGIAEKISLKTAGLKDQGVTQRFLVDNTAVSTMKIYENLEKIARSMYALTEEEEEFAVESILETEGFQMTSSALEFQIGREAGYAEGDSYISVLTTSEGDTAGAMAVSIEGRNTKLGAITELQFLGTTGIVDGAGSMLYGQAINYAYKNKTGMQLTPLSDAIPFWESMGFKRVPPVANQTQSSYWEMSFEEVEAIWKELTIVEGAMPNA